jgi:ribonuclease VapC
LLLIRRHYWRSFSTNQKETQIVAALRQRSEDMARLIEGIGFEVEAVTPATAERVFRIYERWGKGLHPAALNFGDCFAYNVANEYSCPLQFVGNGFARTDLASALAVDN